MSERWDDAFALFVERDWTQIAIDDALADRPALAASVMAGERVQLDDLCAKTLVLELNCARMLGQLTGDTPEERFAHFTARFRTEAAWAALFEEYPVLGATVDGVRRNFRAQAGELFARLAQDRPRLAELGIANGARLVDATASLSDPHCGGRGVWRLAFEGGARVMYKPKPLAADAHFQRLLGVCNAAIERGELAVPPLRPLGIVDRGAYGWVEFVATDPCADDAAVARFYERQGALLALLHVVLGTDMHGENVIACGEHPIVVDYETLFHPYLARLPAAGTAAGEAGRGLERSVLRVGLLPWRARVPGGGLVLGALGDGKAQTLPLAVPRWDAVGRDDMRLVPKSIALPAGHSIPRVGDDLVPFRAHAVAITRGCDAMLRYLSQHRAAWDEHVAAFARDPVRFILRPTQTYMRILDATSHPDHLRGRASGDAIRAKLDTAPDTVAIVARVRDAENADLVARDVPYFHGVPASADAYDSRDARYADLFPEPMLGVARAQLAALDDAEVERQQWHVRAALSAASIGDAMRLPWTLPSASARALDLAAAIGERLAAQAIEGSDGVTWTGVVDCDADAFTVGVLGPELYDGVAGIAVFLAALGRATRDDRFLVLADRAARTVRASLHEPAAHGGGFIGAPSRLYALAHVAALLGEPLGELPIPAVTDETDVMYGAAGAILALLAVAPALPAVAAALRPALAVLERTAIASDAGLAWPCPAVPRPLLGFSHGTAGIAYALDRLAAFDPALASRCAALADGARRYERAHFDAARGNWPDLRVPEGRNVVTWCHGAPGVVLSMLASPGAELDTAIATTLAAPQLTHSLCHGVAGNLAIVAHAAHRLGRADWRAAVEARLPALLAAIASPAGPQLDAAFAPSAPGLMTGLAGVGYGLLSIAAPSTPCLLALDGAIS
ncbi:MAG TPA: type 2 lanthipeptide synthetase LanM family protein [Kofleriaceae bacterium]|jgi:type 2 lantibiotic biosynthesis protein LanM